VFIIALASIRFTERISSSEHKFTNVCTPQTLQLQIINKTANINFKNWIQFTLCCKG
jgi:hypothetical protein